MQVGLGHFIFYPHSPPPPTLYGRLSYVLLFLLSAPLKIASEGFKMLSASKNKTEAALYVFYCFGGRKRNGMSNFIFSSSPLPPPPSSLFISLPRRCGSELSNIAILYCTITKPIYLRKVFAIIGTRPRLQWHN